MSKLIAIHKAIQDILDTLPNHSKRIYLLEDYEPNMNTIEIMYDSYREERKCVYIDKNGAYIAGRGQGQGDKSKMYFHEFDQLYLSNEAQSYISTEVEKINGALDTRIPSKDIKVGDLCREYCEKKHISYHYIYLGKCEITYDHNHNYYKHKRDMGIVKEKTNIYLSLYDSSKYKIVKGYDGYGIKSGYFSSSKTKIRFDKKVSIVPVNDVSKMRKAFEIKEKSNTNGTKLSFKWLG